ncbi:MAG TPA: hypothetical protein VK522_24315 [Pseudolabrys sp.]|nr:hypothetical protein [Pseudolabrys sp.]
MTDTSNTAKPPPTDKQTPPPEVQKSWARRILGDFNPLRVIGGFVLAFLVVAAAASAVIFFAAAQFQSRVAELSLNGAPMTIWRVDAFRGEFKDWAEDIRQQRKDITQDRINLANDKQKNLVSTADQETVEARLGDDARSLKQRVVAASPQLTLPAPISTSNISDTITQIELLLTQEDLQKRFGDELANLKQRQAGNENLRAAGKTREAKIKGYETWIAALEERRKDRVDAGARLFGESNTAAAPELVERIVNATAELNSLQSIWRGIIYRTALWTNDMLVLLLLISMGVLGSALNLLAVFIANERESLSFGEYPLRLAFGAVLAIVMFIIAKAGVPILADTSKIGGNAPLNPYFISLLAVVSGLMSDRSMSTIRNVASSLLTSVGGADYSPRYSRVVLDDVLKAANRDIDGLAQLLGTSTEDAKKLFSGNDAVPPDRQKLISAYLGRPVRELFSDLPAG